MTRPPSRSSAVATRRWTLGVVAASSACLLVLLAAFALLYLASIPESLNPRYDGGPLREVRSMEGEVEVREEVDSRGLRHGESTRWHEGRMVLRGRYADDREEGLWTGWHPDGGKSFEGTYVAGELHGAWREWHPSGRLAAAGTYEQGRQHGPWHHWRPDGALDLGRSGHYVRGERLWDLLPHELGSTTD